MTSRQASGLAGRIAAVMAVDASAPAVEFDGRWATWGELASTARSVAGQIPSPGVEVGILLRNHPVHVGLLLGVLMAEGCVVTINPGRGVERTRDDVESLALAFVAGTPDDVSTFVGPASDATVLTARALGDAVTAVGGAGDPRSDVRPGVAVRMLTSGTTGPPKRVDLSYDTLQRVLTGAKHYESRREESLQLRSGVAIVNSPLVHLGGLFRVLQCVNDGRSFSLLERFTVDGWVDAVRRHRPKTASLVPAALRMVLQSDTDPEDLRSIRSVVCGTAPLAPEDADAFTARFGIPVLVSYAATEFGGGVAGWNLADHREFWSSKRGSVGRAHPGVSLRIVDAASGRVLGAGEDGVLEVLADQINDGSSWVRTTDLARMDGDGFLWILGRADQAIIRGGFKVLPDDVRAALESHPLVSGAAVVGVPDDRLGEVPVAAVELQAGASVDPEELLAHSTGILARYELPTSILIVDRLPRTASAKVDLVAVRSLFDRAGGRT